MEKIIAGAHAAPPATTAFERTVRTTAQEDGSAVETRVRVDRWGGQQLTPVIIDSKPPTSSGPQFGKFATTRTESAYNNQR